MHDNDLGAPDPLRLRALGGVPGLSTEERLKALTEFVVQLDDRVKDAENLLTEIVTRDVKADDDA